MKLPLTVRVVGAILVVVLAFATAVGWAVAEQRALLERLSRVNQGYVTLLRGFDDVRRDVSTLSGIARLPEPWLLQRSLEASLSLVPVAARVDAELDALGAIAARLRESAETVEERSFLTNLGVLVADLRVENERIGGQARALVARLESSASGSSRDRNELRRRLSALDKRLEDATGLVEQRVDLALAEYADEQRAVLLQSARAVGLAAALALLLAAFVARSLRPVADLTAAAERMRAGEYAIDVRTGGADEVGRLVAAFRAMSAAIVERDASLRRQRDALEAAYAELVEAQAARVGAERLAAVGAMSARVAHELRNPLSTIRLNAEMLREDLDSAGASPEALELLDAIRAEVERLSALTADYLRVTREAAGVDGVDARAVLRDVVAQLGPELGRDGIAIETDGDPVWVGIGDAPLRQVLLNLVRNAHQAITEGRDTERGSGGATIRLRTRVENGIGVIAVEDDGPGVAATVTGRLFEPFVTTRASGTGLGLNICRQIALAHGGEVVLAASEPGRSTVFEVRLPRVRGGD